MTIFPHLDFVVKSIDGDIPVSGAQLLDPKGIAPWSDVATIDVIDNSGLEVEVVATIDPETGVVTPTEGFFAVLAASDGSDREVRHYLDEEDALNHAGYCAQCCGVVYTVRAFGGELIADGQPG